MKEVAEYLLIILREIEESMSEFLEADSLEESSVQTERMQELLKEAISALELIRDE